jgi:hypothetical protein
MDNPQPTSEDLQAYEKVNKYLESKISKQKAEDRFSFLPKPKWLALIIITAVAIVAFSSYYGLTTLLFGEEFWIRSITGSSGK